MSILRRRTKRSRPTGSGGWAHPNTTSINQRGYMDSSQSNGNVKSLESNLWALLSVFRLKPSETESRLLRNNLKLLEAKIGNSEAVIAQLQADNQVKEEEIRRNREERLSGEHRKDQKPFLLGAMIKTLLALTMLALAFVFYASSAQQSYFQSSDNRLQELISEGGETLHYVSESVLLVDVFEQAEQHPMTLFYVLSFPFLFISLAVALRHFHKRRQWWIFSSLVLLTFGVDVALSIKVVKDLHEFRLLTGLINTPFDLKTALLSLNFILTIISGLVMFLVFEIFLHLSLAEWEKLIPATILRRNNGILKRQIRVNLRRIKYHERRMRPHRKQKAVIESRLSGELPSFQELDEWMNSYLLGWLRHIQNSGISVKARCKACRRMYDRTLREMSKLFKTINLS